MKSFSSSYMKIDRNTFLEEFKPIYNMLFHYKFFMQKRFKRIERRWIVESCRILNSKFYTLLKYTPKSFSKQSAKNFLGGTLRIDRYERFYDQEIEKATNYMKILNELFDLIKCSNEDLLLLSSFHAKYLQLIRNLNKTLVASNGKFNICSH